MDRKILTSILILGIFSVLFISLAASLEYTGLTQTERNELSEFSEWVKENGNPGEENVDYSGYYEYTHCDDTGIEIEGKLFKEIEFYSSYFRQREGIEVILYSSCGDDSCYYHVYEVNLDGFGTVDDSGFYEYFRTCDLSVDGQIYLSEDSPGTNVAHEDKDKIKANELLMKIVGFLSDNVRDAEGSDEIEEDSGETIAETFFIEDYAGLINDETEVGLELEAEQFHEKYDSGIFFYSTDSEFEFPEEFRAHSSALFSDISEGAGTGKNYHVLIAYTPDADIGQAGSQPYLIYVHDRETADGCPAFKEVTDSFAGGSLTQELTSNDLESKVSSVMAKMENFFSPGGGYDECTGAGEAEEEDVSGGLSLGNVIYMVDSSDPELVMKSLPLAVYHYVPAESPPELKERIRRDFIRYNPFLLYHENDPESMLHFIDIAKRENPKITSAMIVSDDEGTVEEMIGMAEDKGLDSTPVKTETIPEIWNWKPTEHDALKNMYDTIVVVGTGTENDNRASLMGSLLASYYNAPLVMYDDTDVEYDFEGKSVFFVGAPIPTNEEIDGLMEGADITYFGDAEEFNVHLQEKMETDKMILVNPMDIEEQYCEDFTFPGEHGTVENPYCRDSLVAPLLASVNNELMVFTDVSPVSSGLDHLDITDMAVDRDNNIYVISRDPVEGKYKLFKYEFTGKGYRKDNFISDVDGSHFLQTPDRKHLYVYGIYGESDGAYLYAYEIEKDHVKEKIVADLGHSTLDVILEAWNGRRVGGMLFGGIEEDSKMKIGDNIRMDNEENLYVHFFSAGDEKYHIRKYEKKGNEFIREYDHPLISYISEYLELEIFDDIDKFILLGVGKDGPYLVVLTSTALQGSANFEYRIYKIEIDEDEGELEEVVKSDGYETHYMLSREIIRQINEDGEYDFKAERALDELYWTTDLMNSQIEMKKTSKQIFYQKPYYYIWDSEDTIIIIDKEFKNYLLSLNDNFHSLPWSYDLYAEFKSVNEALEKNAKIVQSGLNEFMSKDGFEEMKYLTVIGSPRSIPLSAYSAYVYDVNSEAAFNKPLDYHYHADPDGDGTADLRPGRIFGITETDTSSYVNLVTLYRIKEKKVGSISMLASVAYNVSRQGMLDLYGRLKDNFDIECWTRFGEEDGCEIYSPKALGKSMAASSIVLYHDHGGTDSLGGDEMIWNDIPEMDGTLLIAPVCLTSDYYSSFKNTLFTANAIRKGALGYLGAVSASHKLETPIGDSFLEGVVSGKTFGEAYYDSAGDTEESFAEYPMNFMFFGDPTFFYSGAEEPVEEEEFDLEEAKGEEWIAFSHGVPTSLEECWKGEGSTGDLSDYKQMVMQYNEEYDFSGLTADGTIGAFEVIVLPDLDGNGEITCGQKTVTKESYLIEWGDTMYKCYNKEKPLKDVKDYLRAVTVIMNRDSHSFYYQESGGDPDGGHQYLNAEGWQKYFSDASKLVFPKLYAERTIALSDLDGNGDVSCSDERQPPASGPSQETTGDGTSPEPGGTGTGGEAPESEEEKEKPPAEDEYANSLLKENYETYVELLEKGEDVLDSYRYIFAERTVSELENTFSEHQIQQFLLSAEKNPGEYEDIGPYLSALLNGALPAEKEKVSLDVRGWDPEYMNYLGQNLKRGRNVIIRGDAGDYLGANLNGGTIRVNGDVGEHIASGAVSGKIMIERSSKGRDDESTLILMKIDKENKPKNNLIIEAKRVRIPLFFWQGTTEYWDRIWPEHSTKYRIFSIYKKMRRESYCEDSMGGDECYQKVLDSLAGMRIVSEDIQDLIIRVNLNFPWDRDYFLMIFVSALIDKSSEESLSLILPEKYIRPVSEYPIKREFRVSYLGAHLSNGKYIIFNSGEIGSNLAYRAENARIHVAVDSPEECEDIKSSIAEGDNAPSVDVVITCGSETVWPEGHIQSRTGSTGNF